MPFVRQSGVRDKPQNSKCKGDRSEREKDRPERIRDPDRRGHVRRKRLVVEDEDSNLRQRHERQCLRLVHARQQVRELAWYRRGHRPGGAVVVAVEAVRRYLNVDAFVLLRRGFPAKADEEGRFFRNGREALMVNWITPPCGCHRLRCRLSPVACTMLAVEEGAFASAPTQFASFP